MALLPHHQDALLALAESKLAEGKLQESADAAEKLNDIALVLPVRMMQAYSLSSTGTDANLDKAIAFFLNHEFAAPAMRAPAAILAVKAMVRRRKIDVADSYLRSLSGQVDARPS